MRPHKETCKCACCLGKRGEFVGKNNPNYKDGRTLKTHICDENGCNNIITFNSRFYGGGKCRSCSKKNIKRNFSDSHKKNISTGMLVSRNVYRSKDGTVYTNNKGYVYEKNNGKWIPQHKLVVERCLGRRIKKGEVVHHINENKSDNRPENLYLFSKRGLHTCFTQLVKYGIIKYNVLKSNIMD